MSVQNADIGGRPTVVSLFAGCGGSSLGYQSAGFRELLAVEWDSSAAAVFRLNFPGVSLYEGDIRVLSGDECMRRAGVVKGELDILDSSPPCQGFSTAGNRRQDDPRNSLAWEVVRLLDELRPKTFILENVTGLVKGPMKRVYLALLAAMRDLGYNCRGAILNAMWFGVAQSRRRIIVLGVRDDLDVEATLPTPQRRPVAVGEVLYRDDMRAAACESRTERHREGLIAAWYKRLSRIGSFDTVRLSSSRCSPTQVAIHRHWHPDKPRTLTIAEAAALQGFPSTFRWVGSTSVVTRLIGNSVPPPLIAAIAKHIRSKILNRKTSSGKVIT